MVRKRVANLNNNPPYMTPPTGTKCPVESIPDGTLTSIFTWFIKLVAELALESDDSASSDAEEESTQLRPQEILSHVCKRWRAVALDIPSFWSFINFSDGPPFERSREWIKRTKDYPFDIMLQCTQIDDMSSNEEDDELDSENDDEEHKEYLKATSFSCYELGAVASVDLPAIRDIILPHVHHWGAFMLFADDPHILHNMLSTLQDADEAREIKIMFLTYHWHSENSLPHGTYTPFGGRAPQLRKLELIEVNLDWSQCTFLRGSALESLTVASRVESLRPTFHDFTQALLGCSNLADLKLSNFGPAEDVTGWPSAGGSTINLPSLTSLSLTGFKSPYLASLLQHLSFPKLHTLMLQLFPMADASALVPALSSAVPLRQLTDFHIDGLRVSNGAAAAGELWKELISLETLRIDNSTMLFGGFLPAWKQPQCFPRVDSLMTSGIGGAGIQALVKARKDNHPLNRLAIQEDSVVTTPQDRWLRQQVPLVAYFKKGVVA